MGIDHRIVNGYVYIAPVGIEDPEIIEKRVQEFTKRAGYYYENWNELYNNKWKQKVNDVIKKVEQLELRDLPEMEDDSVVFDNKGKSRPGTAKPLKNITGCRRILSGL